MKITKNSGFTLLELLIVFAILGIVLAIAAPNYSRYRDNTNLKEAAGDIYSDIKLYKQKSVSENVRYRIVFNAGANTYAIQREKDDGSWESIAIKDVGASNAAIKISEDPDPTFTDDTVTFQTRGTTNGGNLVLQHIRRLSTAKIITSSMGRVRIEYDIK